MNRTIYTKCTVTAATCAISGYLTIFFLCLSTRRGIFKQGYSTDLPHVARRVWDVASDNFHQLSINLRLGIISCQFSSVFLSFFFFFAGGFQPSNTAKLRVCAINNVSIRKSIWDLEMLLKIEQAPLEPHLMDTHDITDNFWKSQPFLHRLQYIRNPWITGTPLLRITDLFCAPSVHNNTYIMTQI